MELPTLRRFLQHVKLIAVIVLIQTAFAQSETKNDDFDEELYSVIHSVRDGSLWTRSRHARSLSEILPPSNRTISDNSLWNDLMYECRKRTSFSCIKSGVFKYLDKSLEMNHDVEVTDSLFFIRNANKYNGYCENSDDGKSMCEKYYQEKMKIMSSNKEDNEINSDGDANAEDSPEKDPKETQDEDITEGAAEGRSIESFSDVSDILYDKGTQFLMTHDMEFQLPHMFFGGGSVKIEPKSDEIEHEEEQEDEESEGTVVKIIFKPPPPTPAQKGRFLFSHLKKLFKKKLMHSFMALMLIIKMIKVKLMFLLPMIVGQSTAKRLLLKVLLFLIPGLAHLFKLCHYYHMEHAKYHHHHHKIKHHHHHVQVPVPVPVPVPVHNHHDSLVHHHVEPSVHHIHDESSYPGSNHDYPPYPSSSSNHISSHPGEDEYEYPPVGGNSGGYNRYGSLSQYKDNEAQMASWGMGSNNFLDVGALDAKDQPVYSGYDAGDDKKVFKKSPYQEGYQAASSLYQNAMGGFSQNVLHNKPYGSKLNVLTPRPPLGVSTIQVSYDPFYSPILQKIDNIFVQLGFNEEACRERLVCSMYKNPHRFSPHSNLVSAELSRDSRELQKPISNNSAVVRFYKYVQAARDGQDHKDCLRLYPSCTVNTEK